MKKRSFAAFSSQGNESFTTPRPRLNKYVFFCHTFLGHTVEVVDSVDVNGFGLPLPIPTDMARTSFIPS